jgi:hypothetical protein
MKTFNISAKLYCNHDRIMIFTKPIQYSTENIEVSILNDLEEESTIIINFKISSYELEDF